MKKLILGLFLAGSLSLPLLAFAASSGGCSSAGGPCVFGGVSGVCAQNQESGDFYCNQTGGGGSTNNANLQFYKDLIVGTINNILVPVLIAIAFIVFLWGIFKAYILNAANETERKNGHQLMLWGIIGFVVIVSVWGIVNIARAILIPGTASTTAPPTPRL